MPAYASLSARDPEFRAFLKSRNIDPTTTRILYIRDAALCSITRTARDQRIVSEYHRHRSAGLGKSAAFRGLLAGLELQLSQKQLRRIVAAHERECTLCRSSRNGSAAHIAPHAGGNP